MLRREDRLLDVRRCRQSTVAPIHDASRLSSAPARCNAGGHAEVPWEPFSGGSHSIGVQRFNDHQRGVLIMRVAVSCLLALALSTAAVSAGAQVTRSKKVLTLEGAKVVATAAAEEAKKGSEGASIAIVDDGGNLIYLERIQPTFPMGATISTEKARTAALFQKPTKILEDAIVGGRTPLLNAWSAPLNGGEPIVVDGQVVGAIGVSGASSAARDAAIAIAGAGSLGARTSASR
jgi:glc operon protein GlcG